MNIDSASFLSALPTQLTMEGTSPPATGSEPQTGFTEAFVAQLTQISGDNNPSELLKSIQTNSATSNPAPLQSLDDLLGNTGDMQKLAAFFGKELPSSYKVNENIDLNAVLPSLTDTLSSANTSETQIQGTAQPNSNQTTIKDSQVIQTDIQPDLAQIMASIEGQNNLSVNVPLSTDTTPTGSDKKEITSANSNQDQPDGLATALLASLLSPVTPSTAQNNNTDKSAELTTFKQPSLTALIKNPSENSGSPASLVDSNQPSDNSLTKLTGESFSEQIKPAFNLNDFEKINLTDKNAPIGQDSGLGGDKNLIRAGAEMNQLSRQPAEIRAEVAGLSKPINHPEWNKDLGERILWMSNRSIPAAEIKLNPQHLGPISVRVDMNQDQATISFAAQHGSVRDALEASIPKLRDMLSSQQLNLIDVNVSQHFSSDQGRSQPQNFAQTTANSVQNPGDISNDAMEEIDSGRAVITKGLLSIYA